MRKSLWLVPALLLIGCAAANYQVHPGAGGYIAGQTPTTAQLFDSQEYDSLVAANAVIQAVQADYLANKFPTSTMPTIRTAANAATAAYNTAQTQWMAFDGALKVGGTPSQAALSSAIVAMNTAVQQLTTAKGGN